MLATQTTTASASAGALLLARARTLAASGRNEAARPLLAAVRRLGSAPADELDQLEALLLLRTGRIGEALALLDTALGRGEGDGLRLIRARARLLADDPLGSAADAAEAVIADPADPIAKAALGIALAEAGGYADAVACLSEALRARPGDPTIRLALGRAHELGGDPAAARATLDGGVPLAPANLALRNAAVRLAIGQGEFERAIALAEAARQAGVLDACLFGMLGHALSCLGRHEAAADAYAEALKLAPEDSYVRHMVATSGRLPASPAAPPEYVRVVFDGYAKRFEAHLISLGYRIPGLLRASVLAHAALPESARLGPVLDLGCGTGLAAVALSDLPLGPWHGVDLSSAMLREAEAKGLYQTLQHMEMTDALAQPGPLYALALAADVFCYLGPLEGVFAALYDRMLPGALVAASFEILPPDAATDGSDWALGPRGRYRHAPDYPARAARERGFAIRDAAAEMLRQEDGAPVAGLILVLQKPAG